MALSEFDLIARFFSHCGERGDVVLGVGDDCALLRAPPGCELAVTVDTLVEGVHFTADVDPASLGHKALAVSLSDLAAMGAEPAWVTLALTLPWADPAWLAGFAQGLSDLAQAYRVQLVGGDTTRGPRSVTTQVIGFVAPGRALRRCGARSGDLIYVSGTLGDAGLALLARQGLAMDPTHLAWVQGRLDRPTPRLGAGRALVGLASAAIDVSDGLVADLGHVLRASGVGATLYTDRLPLSAAVARHVRATGDWSLPLSAGDDYELCVTVPASRQGELEALAGTVDCALAWVGVVESGGGLRCVLADGRELTPVSPGYDHFARHV